jgi:hypothetical protein
VAADSAIKSERAWRIAYLLCDVNRSSVVSDSVVGQVANAGDLIDASCIGDVIGHRGVIVGPAAGRDADCDADL